MTTVPQTTPKLHPKTPHIYLLKDVANNALKIGFSIDTGKRFKNHSGSNPFLKFLMSIPVESQQVERDLHRIISPYRLPETSEWYIDSPRLREHLNAYFLAVGSITDNNWILLAEMLPGLESSLKSYLGLSRNSENQLKLMAWFCNKSIEVQARFLLTETLDAESDQIDRTIAYYASVSGLTPEQLERKILDGKILTGSLPLTNPNIKPRPEVSEVNPNYDDH